MCPSWELCLTLPVGGANPSPQFHVCCYVLLIGNLTVSRLICLIITQDRKALRDLRSEVVIRGSCMNTPAPCLIDRSTALWC